MRAKIARFSNSAWSDLHEEHTTGTSHLIPSVAHLAHEAGAALRKKLIGKYVLDEMPSRDLVEFSHYHTVSGGVGLEDLAMDPQKVKFNENFNKHVKLVLAKEFPSPSYYYAGIPMIEKLASRREMISQPFVPFFEDISADYSEIPHDPTKRCPHPMYEQNIVVQRALLKGFPRSHIIPGALYWDATCYTKRDSFLGLFCINLFNGRRYLMVVLRASTYKSVVSSKLCVL